MMKKIVYLMIVLLILVAVTVTAAKTFDMKKIDVMDSTIKIKEDIRQNKESKSVNTLPVAEANGPYTGYNIYAIQFSSAGSYDSDGNIVSYEWDFGDGFPINNEQNPIHGYQPGIYTATLCVEDNDGDQDCDNAQVTVTEAVCTDSDNGQDLYTVGTTEGLYGNAGVLIKSDSCKFNGEVIEYFCSEPFMQYTSIECPQGERCDNGICAPYTPEPEPEEAYCSDSDGGIDLEVAGTTIGIYGVAPGNSTMNDYCISGQTNDGKLVEYFCSYGRVQYHKYDCPQGLECNNGECTIPQIPDSDNDGVPDPDDICPGHDDNIDTDNDGTPDGCDVCPDDEFDDIDNDGVCANDDNCPNDYNPNQENSDYADNQGDACDPCPNDLFNDLDGDGICGDVDICPLDPDNDIDGDGVCSPPDNCPNTYNPDQNDTNQNFIGDACEAQVVCTPAQAATTYGLEDYPTMYDDGNGGFTGILVVSAAGPAEDVIAITNIAMGLNNEGFNPGPNAVKLDTEITDFCQNMIIVGEVCENTVMQEVLGYDQNNCSDAYADLGVNPDEGYIGLFESTEGYNYLIVTGEDSSMRRDGGTAVEEHNHPDFNGQYMIFEPGSLCVPEKLTNGGINNNSAIYDRYVTWITFDGNDHELYLYDIYTETTIPITNNTYDDIEPIITEDYILWKQDDGTDYELMLYDINAQTIIQITNNAYLDTHHAISGDYVVWGIYDQGYVDINLYEISTATTTQLTNDMIPDVDPTIDGDYVSWLRIHDNDYDVHMYEISTSTTTQLTANTLNEEQIFIYGDYMAWKEVAGPHYEIFLYDVDAGSSIRLTNNAIEDLNAVIHEDYVVWHDAEVTSDVVMHEISTGTTTQLTNTNFAEVNPDINEMYVVWETEDLMYSNLTMYNIGAGTTNQVSILPGFNEYPDLYQNYVVWENEDVDRDIYILDLSLC